MVTGSSGSGKTWLTAFLLKNRKIVFDCQPAIVIWFYREGTNQEIYEQLRDEKWVDEFYAVSKNGFGEIKDLLNKFPRSQPKFFIYDDLMTMISMDTAELFTNKEDGTHVLRHTWVHPDRKDILRRQGLVSSIF